MKFKLIILVFFILIQLSLVGQTISYTYDDNGNRIRRTYEVEELQSGSFSFPATPEILKLSAKKGSASEEEEFMKSKEPEEVFPEEGEIKTAVYPNPNKGLIKIEISNLPMNSKNEMRLYDLSGKEITVRRNFESYSEIDISKFKDGIYILRIRINESIFDWKVIKNN